MRRVRAREESRKFENVPMRGEERMPVSGLVVQVLGLNA